MHYPNNKLVYCFALNKNKKLNVKGALKIYMICPPEKEKHKATHKTTRSVTAN